jgi:hypothetical protein
MDYSEQISKIRNDYFLTMLGYIALMIIALAFIIFLLIKIYQGTELFKVFHLKYLIHISIILSVLIGCFFWTKSNTDLFRDITNIKNGNYILDVCLIIEPSNIGNPEIYEDRYPKCQSLDSESEYYLVTFYTPMNVGEVYEVIYLENTKIGRVIKEVD